MDSYTQHDVGIPITGTPQISARNLGGRTQIVYNPREVYRLSDREINGPRVIRRHPFEGYWTEIEFKEDALDIFIARGSVCRGDEKQVGTEITAGDGTLDSIFTLTSAYPLIYLKCIFNSNGGIYALTFEQEADAVDCCYENGPDAGQNTWWHPILRYRAHVTSKSTANALPGNPYADSGEEETIGGKEGWTIYQLTNTHLVGQQQCMTDYEGVTRTAWKLVPGPGATSGAGA